MIQVTHSGRTYEQDLFEINREPILFAFSILVALFVATIFSYFLIKSPPLYDFT